MLGSKLSTSVPRTAGPAGAMPQRSMLRARTVTCVQCDGGISSTDITSTSSRRALLAAAALVTLATPGSAVANDQALDATAAATAPVVNPVKPDTKVFFNVEIEGEPVGRIVVQLFDDVNVGAARFRDLAVGKQGVGYRLNRIDGIFDTHLRVEGEKSLSRFATGESPIAGGDSIAELKSEMDSAKARGHAEAGLVSLTVLEAEERPVTEKLVAKDGKFVTVQMQAGEAPNGTGFIITRGSAPDLDRTNLVVGKVVEGMDLVEQVAALPFSKPREAWYDGPFFAAGKAMGDKRAVVAEKGFNRPFKIVKISKAGLLA